jgi:CheY-like chemotaxis protein
VTREGPDPDGQIATVLVADDELHIVDLLASIVEELGHTVIRAGNGEQALRAILEHPPSLVLTDVMMPRLRGDELCRRVKASAETAGIAVVLLTSLPPGNFDGVGADAYIAKPFAIEQVAAVVARFLSGGVREGRATDV